MHVTHVTHIPRWWQDEEQAVVLVRGPGKTVAKLLGSSLFFSIPDRISPLENIMGLWDGIMVGWYLQPCFPPSGNFLWWENHGTYGGSLKIGYSPWTPTYRCRKRTMIRPFSHRNHWFSDVFRMEIFTHPGAPGIHRWSQQCSREVPPPKLQIGKRGGQVKAWWNQQGPNSLRDGDLPSGKLTVCQQFSIMAIEFSLIYVDLP